MDKHKEKIKAMSKGGRRLGVVLEELAKEVKPGITTLEIDKLAEKLILEQGGQCAFKTVPGYKWATCINIDDGVVHGIPNKTVIENGDVVSIDVGMIYEGFFTDTSTTLVVGEATSDLKKFLSAGKEALARGIEQAKVGNRVGHISQAIEKTLGKYGLKAIPELTGHGVGERLHEKPFVPGLLLGKLEDTPLLYEGQTLAIEVIYTSGSPKIVVEDDGWTISTKDGKISGLFEETVAILNDGPRILTLPADN